VSAAGQFVTAATMVAATAAALAAPPTEGEGAGRVATPASASPLRYFGPVPPPPYWRAPLSSPRGPFESVPGRGTAAGGSGRGGFHVSVSVDVEGGLAGWMPWNWRFWR